MIVDKIDTDKDGFVTEGELKAWLKKAQMMYVYDSVEHQRQEYDLSQDGLISWDEYRNVTYGTYLGKGQGLRAAAQGGWAGCRHKVKADSRITCLLARLLEWQHFPPLCLSKKKL